MRKNLNRNNEKGGLFDSEKKKTKTTAVRAKGRNSLSLAANLSSGAFAARLRWSASLFPHPLKRHCIGFYQDLNFDPTSPF